jgi:hypothetical protein
MPDRREQIREWYRLDFPDDLFAVWELARSLRPEEPSSAFEPIPFLLDGVFDVLKGDLDDRPPAGLLWTHDMSYNDPPEFFVIAWGEGDGHHFGLWFDDPTEPPSCVVSYYNNDAYDLSHYPANLFLMLRRELEYNYQSAFEDQGFDPSDPCASVAFAPNTPQRLDALREALRPHLPGAAKRRKQQGQAYLDRYTDQDVDDWNVVGVTWGQECISAPAHLYAAPPADDETIWEEVRQAAGASRWLREAERALRDGFPATALKLGKDVRHLGPKEAEADACGVMKSAYHALGRPLLAEVLQARQEQRDLWDAERAAAEKK